MREGYPEFRTKGAPCNEFTSRNRQKTTEILSVPFLIFGHTTCVACEILIAQPEIKRLPPAME